MIAAAFDGTFEGWRAKARELLAADVAPEDVLWTEGASLFGELAGPLSPVRQVSVPKQLLTIAETVACHREDRRWPLLYGILYRIANGERELLRIESDEEVRELLTMEREVRHDLHRMHAFVRFRRVEGSSSDEYVAWHQPDHRIVKMAAPWFAERFAAMRWSILTPDESVHWDGRALSYGPGVPRSQAPQSDGMEDLWRSYYGSVFNPARVNPELMKQHMPSRYWAAMPETQIIPDLVADAPARQRGMLQTAPMSAALFVPAGADLPVLREAVQACRGCELYCPATQAVFGEGPSDARLALVGEQPGEQEDVEGRPFAGPAGQLLDRALAEAGMDRGSVYLTNAVKHFRFEERGKRRIHKTASKAQVAACQPWIDAEMELVRPKLILCLGRTAALSILGRDVTIGRVREQVFSHRSGGGVMVTVHPSYLLRLPDAARQAEEYGLLVQDLRRAQEFVGAA